MRYNDITRNEAIDQEHKDRAYRQFVASSSKDRHDDLAVRFGQLNDAMDAIRHGENDGPVAGPEPKKDPLLLRPFLAVLTLIAVASATVGIIAGLGGVIFWKIWGVFAVSGGIRGAYAYWKYRKDQQAWIDRMKK